MKPEQKRKLAEKLVDLAVIDPVRTPIVNDSPIEKNLELEMREKIRDQQIEARVKHYTEEQLLALVEFYGSDLGKSISEARRTIYEEFTGGLHLITADTMEKVKNSMMSQIQSRSNKNDT